MDKAASPSTLRQDVLNVIWNGYPYFAGSWKGVDRDFAAIGQNSGLSGAVVEQLNNIAVTQQAIWALTDSRPGAGNTQSYVNALIAASQKNPAPANFGLDLYDGSAAKSTTAGKKMTNLVAVSAAQQKPASIKLSHRWLDEKRSAADWRENAVAVFRALSGKMQQQTLSHWQPMRSTKPLAMWHSLSLTTSRAIALCQC